MWDNNVPFIFLLLIPIPQFLARKSTVSLHIQALLSRRLVNFVVDAFGAQTEKPFFFFPITNARSLQSTNQPTTPAADDVTNSMLLETSSRQP